MCRPRAREVRRPADSSSGRAAAARPRLDRVFFELVAELGHHASHRHRHRVAEHAQAVADDVLLHRGDDVEVHRGRLAGDHPLEHLHRPVGALAARGALPARLVVVEARRAQRQLGDRDRVVGDDDRPRAEHRARVGHRLEAVGEVELGRGQDRRRGAAREPCLDLAPVGRAAGEPVDQLAGGDPELDLVVAGPLHAARDRDDLGAGRLLGAEPLEPLGAVGDDVGHVGQRLDVVDQGRPAVEALDRRERRLEARVAALSLERVEQRRLLAADVGAGAAVDDHLDPVAAAEDVLAQVAGLVRLGDGAVEDVGHRRVLAPDEHEPPARAGGQRRDRDPLDQLVRVLLHQLAVLERARLRLVGVAAQVLRHLAAGQERGLLSHREAGPAAAAQPGLLEHAEQLLGLQVAKGALQRAVAAQAPVGVDRGQPGLVDALEQHPRLRVGPGLRAAGRRAIGERLVGQDLGAGAKLLDRGLRVTGVQGPVVALVDRGHRGDVAGAQALEARDEDLPVRRAGAAVIGLVRHRRRRPR